MLQLDPRQRLFWLMLAGEAGLGLLGGLLMLTLNAPPEIQWREPQSWGYGLLATLPLLLIFQALQWATWEPLRRFRDYLDRQVIPLFREWRWWQIALISAAAGWGEELLFRGWLQTFAGEYIGTTGGLIAASLLFGAAHAMTRLYFFLAVLMGLYFGVLYLWSGDLLIPMLAHGLYDAAALWWLTRSERAE